MSENTQNEPTPAEAQAALSAVAKERVAADANALDVYASYITAKQINVFTAAAIRSQHGSAVLDRGRHLAEKLRGNK